MKRESILVLFLASIAIVAILMVAVAPALADYASTGKGAWGKGMGEYKERMGRMGYEHKDVYTTVAVDGMSGDSASFTVMDMAAKGKDGMGVLIKPNAPLTGKYNATENAGYVMTENFLPMTITVDTADKTAIPVAGASAVMGVGDIKVLVREKGYHVFQYRNVSFYLPNGSTMAYRLDKPVHCTYSKDRDLMVIDGYPEYTKVLMDAFGSGDKFPADAAPVPLTSIAAAKKAATVVKVAYEMPAYVPPPISQM